MDRNTQLKNILREENLRYTSQRQAIWDEISGSDEHRTAEEIYIALHNRKLSVSRATVYRTVEVLVKNKLARKLDVGEGMSRYEHRLSEDHHDHLICTKCGVIIEFSNKKIEKLQKMVAREFNFILKRHHHQLFGICSNCQ